jgi:hypothetical protein
MPIRPPNHCNGPGPHADMGRAYGGGSLCTACRKVIDSSRNSDRPNRRAIYPAFYDKHRKAIVNWGNILCQRVELVTRVYCGAPADVLHHLLAADHYPQFLCDWRNCVRVCRHHHSTSAGDKGDCLYLPTITPSSLGGVPPLYFAPGAKVPINIVLWSLDSQKRILIER